MQLQTRLKATLHITGLVTGSDGSDGERYEHSPTLGGHFAFVPVFSCVAS